MDILDKIIADKYKEVEAKKKVIPSSQLEASELFNRPVHSMKDSLLNTSSGIIAEHKRRSPSKSVINHSLSVINVAKAYESAGAGGMSVLTDGKYFGGSLDDLILARSVIKLPLLRKEFIIDEYQILEARAYGADAILLIAAVLDRKEIKKLSEFAHQLEMEVLLEVHNREELEKSIMPSLDMLGVNNRNLKTFEVSLETSTSLAVHIPDEFLKVSESGLKEAAQIKKLRTFGYRGFLMGEFFMKHDNPGKVLSDFIKEINS